MGILIFQVSGHWNCPSFGWFITLFQSNGLSIALQLLAIEAILLLNNTVL